MGNIVVKFKENIGNIFKSYFFVLKDRPFFKGRLDRKTYLGFLLIHTIVLLVFFAIWLVVGETPPLSLLFGICFLVYAIFSLSAFSKRLHDIGISGVIGFLVLCFFVGLILAFIRPWTPDYRFQLDDPIHTFLVVLLSHMLLSLSVTFVSITLLPLFLLTSFFYVFFLQKSSSFEDFIWYLGLLSLPSVHAGALLVLSLPGMKGDNKYGEVPKTSEVQSKKSSKESMNKKTMLIVGGVVFVIMLVVCGVFLYKRLNENSSNINAEYKKCIEEVKALQNKNDKIVAKVDADIEKCTRDYIKGKGYIDSINCIQDDSNPICESTERYNAEVNGSNECMKDRDARLIAEGYKNGVHEAECSIYRVDEKPVLYLYPTEDNTKVTVSFANPSLLTTTYPKYEKEWHVTANKNGDLYDENNKYYYGLYWEENAITLVDFSTGFFVTKDNAISFLEDKLSHLGLNDKERNEFIMYWLPVLEKNGNSLVYFELTDERESFNSLHITPRPDSLLRLSIHIKKVDGYTNVKEQKLPSFERKGFSAIEWGGMVH